MSKFGLVYISVFFCFHGRISLSYVNEMMPTNMLVNCCVWKFPYSSLSSVVNVSMATQAIFVRRNSMNAHQTHAMQILACVLTCLTVTSVTVWTGGRDLPAWWILMSVCHSLAWMLPHVEMELVNIHVIVLMDSKAQTVR